MLIKRVFLRPACIQVSSEQASYKSSRLSMARVHASGTMHASEHEQLLAQRRSESNWKKANEAKGTLVISTSN
jgi:hypothetical protein